MSWFTSKQSLYRENKKFKRSQKVMKKVKIPTNMKTIKCSLQEYGGLCSPAQHTINKNKQSFHLCSKHFNQYKSGLDFRSDKIPKYNGD